MQQLNHYNTQFEQRTFPVTVVCENVSNAPNIGSLFRICDAFGVEKLIFCGDHLPIPSRKMQKTSRATEKAVHFQIISHIQDVIQDFQETHTLVALEITQNSIPVHEYRITADRPIVLIIGDENFGVSEEVLSLCDKTIHIEMFGQNSSMNVVQATNIALYEITKQLLT